MGQNSEIVTSFYLILTDPSNYISLFNIKRLEREIAKKQISHFLFDDFWGETQKKSLTHRKPLPHTFSLGFSHTDKNIHTKTIIEMQ